MTTDEMACRGDAAQESKEVALPRNPALARQQAPQHAAVQDAGDHPDDDRPDAAFEEPARQEIAEVAKDDATGPDGNAMRSVEEPYSEAADHDGEQRDDE